MRRVDVSTGARQAIACKAQVGDSVGMRVRGQSAGRVLCMLAGALSVSVAAWAGAAQPLRDAREPWLWPSGDPVPVARAFDDLEHNWLPGIEGSIWMCWSAHRFTRQRTAQLWWQASLSIGRWSLCRTDRCVQRSSRLKPRSRPAMRFARVM